MVWDLRPPHPTTDFASGINRNKQTLTKKVTAQKALHLQVLTIPRELRIIYKIECNQGMDIWCRWKKRA